jgi:hypothetical protein
MADSDSPESLSVRSIYRVITYSDEPALTAAEIAEKLGVTPQAVYRYMDEVAERDDIYQKPIGNATAYYQQTRPPRESGEYDELMERIEGKSLKKARQDYAEGVTRRLCHDRADFLQARSRLQVASQTGAVGIFERERYLSSLNDYLQTQAVMECFDLLNYQGEKLDLEGGGSESESVEWDAEPFPPRGSSLSDEDMDHYLRGVPMFESDWFGTVEGLGGLKVYITKHTTRVKNALPCDEEGEITSDIEADLEETLPSVNDLLAVGDKADSIISEVFELRWGL